MELKYNTNYTISATLTNPVSGSSNSIKFWFILNQPLSSLAQNCPSFDFSATNNEI